MFKVAICNRGAAAARLVRTIREMGCKSIVLCSEADQDLPYVKKADEFAVIGPPPPKDSYLNQEAVIQAALAAKAEALHPGWGFLAENAAFARKAADNHLIFIGPSPKFLEIMGHKVSARDEMVKLGLPVAPSTGELSGTISEMAETAAQIGFPLLIKPAGGGGGIGMTPAESREKLEKALETAQNLAQRSFGSASLYAERLLTNPRHVEFQIVADRLGTCVHLGERDCSVQRRRQKILEEAGAPNLAPAEVAAMAAKAAEVMARIGYDSLGTVETLYSPETGFSFLEVNPRLQVEHGVTEEIAGLDLVEAQLTAARGESVGDLLKRAQANAPGGHALEARIYAEDSLRFFPSPGRLSVFRPPKAQKGRVRVETGYAEGSTVTPFYDPMMAQVIVHGQDRQEAIALMEEALAAFEIAGVKSNVSFLRLMLRSPKYLEGAVNVSLAEELVKSPEYKADLEAL
ncbi:MAG: ATP-grasp domain-containing protein [Deltaproteobacteria bacterium]|nr:ATP-grasp domain-containing protein [Deltaproteobacteria bacterium]